MFYTSDQISIWIKEGQAISPHVAAELLAQNSLFKSLITEAIEIIESEDTILLRRMDIQALREWRDKVTFLLDQARN